MLETQRTQIFPILAPEEIARVRTFGRLRRFAAGERVFRAGKASPGVYVVLSGMIRITDCDSRGRELVVVEHGAGAFCGELSELSCGRSFFDALAVSETQALEIDAGRLQVLLTKEAALGEKLMRAMILRRLGPPVGA